MTPANEFLMGVMGESVVFVRPVPQKLTREQAITLAAWLVTLADPGHELFDRRVEELLQS